MDYSEANEVVNSQSAAFRMGHTGSLMGGTERKAVFSAGEMLIMLSMETRCTAEVDGGQCGGTKFHCLSDGVETSSCRDYQVSYSYHHLYS